MSPIKKYLHNLVPTFGIGAFVILQLQAQIAAQTTTIPEAYAIPSAIADTSKPGFIFRISTIAQDTSPNSLATAEQQLAGLLGNNLADPAAVNIAVGPAQAANPASAPLAFEIATVINVNRGGGDSLNRGDFTPNDEMPGLPGPGGDKSNIAGEVLTYLDLPAGTLSMGVISSTFHRVQIGGVTLGDQFGLNVGQMVDDNRRGGHSFTIIVTKAGLYPARVLFENAGDSRAYVEWFTGNPGAKVLMNDVAKGGIKAYRALLTPLGLAYSRLLSPASGALNVAPDSPFHAELVDGMTAINKTNVSAQIDGVAVTPKATVNKTGNVNSVDFTSAAPLTPGLHTASLIYTEGGSSVTRSWSFTVGKYVTLDPAWRVAGVDSTKPGFNWNIFANSDGGNQANTAVRAETDLSLLATDSSGAALPNLADPNAKGVAIAAAAAANPANAPIHFEIDTVINLDATQNMPGAPSTDGSNNGQAAEILTYLTLPPGVITMDVGHDDAFSTASGPNPQDAFGRVELGGDNGATSTRFFFLVQQAGTYPFRTVWENGGGGSVLRWSTVKADGTTVLVNDLANGGIPAFRASTAPTAPYVKGANPPPVPRQLEAYSSSVSVVLVDGANPIVDASVSFQLDGKATTTPPVRQGKYLTVNTGPVPGFAAAGEAHTAVITFKDSTGASRTQQWKLYNLQNLVLPASPVAGENFDSSPEATSQANTVPAGWVATNYTLRETPGWDLTHQNSDAFMDWVVIATDTAAGIEQEVLQNDPSQLINGQPIGDWMQGNLLFAASDGRRGDGNPQVQIAVSKPFNLSSVTNPVLTFYSGQRLSDNRSEADAVEYSVDGGATWLPAAYYHFRTLSLNPDGSYDAVTMLDDPGNAHVPTWNVPGVAGVSGGTFGAGIGAPVSPALAPFIAERSNNQSSRRVEAIRISGASKKSDVRVRFAHVGSCGWEWAIDNVAIYDIAPSGAAAATTPSINVDFNTTAAASTTYSGTAAAPDTGTTWNGVAIGSGPLVASFTSGALVASDGSATPVTVSLGNFKQYNAAENKATLATALLTDFAYQQNLGPGGPDSTFSINNLDPAKGYDLYLYGQNGGYALTVTIFTINGVSQYTTNKGNISSFIEGTNYTVFRGMSADASGKISGTFNVAKVADNAAFNGLQIVEAPKAATKPNITGITASNGSITITWVNGGTLESSPSLTAPVWTTTGNSSGTFTETISASGNKFYRVKL